MESAIGPNFVFLHLTDGFISKGLYEEDEEVNLRTKYKLMQQTGASITETKII